MPDTPAPAPRADNTTVGPEDRVSLNRLILICIAVIAAILLAVLVIAVGPRWWAQRVGNMVDGRLFMGSVIGIVFGMVFTIAPLVLLAVAARHLRTIKKAVAALVVGLLLALPNIATLAIVVGTGSAAHAGERILDVDGPGFRGGSLVGAIIGSVLAAWIIYLMWSRRRRGDELARLSAEEKSRKASEGASAD